MCHQTLVTLIKIVSPSSACVARGLKLDSKLKTCEAKKSVAWRNNEIQTDLTKRWDERSLKIASVELIEPLIGSVLRDGGLSACKHNGSFGLDKMMGLRGTGGDPSFLPNAFLFWVPCRTLKTMGGDTEVDQRNNSGFFAKIRNQLVAASRVAAGLTASPEKSDIAGLVRAQPTKWITVCHEIGHVLVAHYTKGANPSCKVTIVPTATSNGVTHYVPHTLPVTRTQLMARLDVHMGGRAAEEAMFGPEKITSGSSDDIGKATSLATLMVNQRHMLERIYLGTLYSSEVARTESGILYPTAMTESVNQEVERMLQEAYERAKRTLQEHQIELRALAEALMKHETLEGDALKIAIIRATVTPGCNQEQL